MRPKSMSVTMAHITLAVQRADGMSDSSLVHFMSTFDVTSPGAVKNYKDKLTGLGFLTVCQEDGTYHVTADAATAQEITITVRPGIVADAFRRHIVEMLASFPDLIEISEVHDVGE